MKKLTIIVLGNNHTDISPYSVLARIYQQLHKNRIPTAFLEEVPVDDNSIEKAKASTNNAIRQSEIFKMLAPELMKLYYFHEKSDYPYLHLSAYETIKLIAQSKFIPLLGPQGSDPSLPHHIAFDLFRENAYREQMKMFDILQELGIYYAGVESKLEVFTKQMSDVAIKGGTAHLDNETSRIDTMCTNILNTCLKFQKGGVLFVFTGSSHAHRLAANILLNSKNHPELTEQLDIHTFRLTSDFVQSDQENTDYSMNLTAPIDSDEIKEIYKILPNPLINCLIKDKQFYFPELESFIEKLINDQAPNLGPLPSTLSMFSELSIHDKFVTKLKEYGKQNPDSISNELMQIVEVKKDYSFALRYICGRGNYNLIMFFLSFTEIPFDFNKTSSNGNTPLKWFELSKADEEQKKQIRTIFIEKMATAPLSPGLTPPL